MTKWFTTIAAGVLLASVSLPAFAEDTVIIVPAPEPAPSTSTTTTTTTTTDPSVEVEVPVPPPVAEGCTTTEVKKQRLLGSKTTTTTNCQ